MAKDKSVFENYLTVLHLGPPSWISKFLLKKKIHNKVTVTKTNEKFIINPVQMGPFLLSMRRGRASLDEDVT